MLVVGGLQREPYIGRVTRCRDPVARHIPHQQRRQHDRRGQHRPDERAGGSREESSRTACIEAGQGDLPGMLEFVQDQAGDQEAGDDEEDVDAHVTAGEAGNTGVIR